jgi:hypothetical protein
VAGNAMTVTLWKATDTYVNIIVDDAVYDILYDEYTGDWQVTSKDDEQVQGDWMKTEDDAIKFVLSLVGVINNVDYRRAPDRC